MVKDRCSSGGDFIEKPEGNRVEFIVQQTDEELGNWFSLLSKII
jgi:hypothetical protein